MKAYDFAQFSGQLDVGQSYTQIANTPWYPGATYARFSNKEFERRYRVTREKMKSLNLDVLLAPGGPQSSTSSPSISEGEASS